MFALIGNFDLTELLVIAVGALLIFGKRLPEVAMRAAAHFMRLRRAVTKMWREAGIEDELRRVRREIEAEVDSIPTPRTLSDEVLDAGARGPTGDSGSDSAGDSAGDSIGDSIGGSGGDSGGGSGGGSAGEEQPSRPSGSDAPGGKGAPTDTPSSEASDLDEPDGRESA